MAIFAYASATSVSPGDTLHIYASSNMATLDVRVFREGAASESLLSMPARPAFNVPTPDSAYAKGCDWPELCAIAIPAGWKSGFYDVHLVAPGGIQTNYIPFAVRGSAAAPSPTLVISAVNTSQAYNAFGGKSLYDFSSTNGKHSYKVSFNRPYDTNFGFGQFPKYELPFTRWFERTGHSADYATDVDLATNPGLLAGRRLLVIVGHDEYWSGSMYDAVQAFVDSGGNVAVLGGNTCFYQARYADQARSLVCYKSYGNASGDPMYPANPESVTVQWGDLVLFRPSCRLLGVMTPSCEATVSLPIRYTHNYAWLTDGLEDQAGSLFGTQVLGYEFDSFIFGFSPSNAVNLFQTFVGGVCPQTAAGIYYEEQPAFDPIYPAEGGGVLNVGTVQWSWGLDTTSAGLPDPRMQRFTGNALAGLGHRLSAANPSTLILRSRVAGGHPAPGVKLLARLSQVGLDTTGYEPFELNDDGVWPDSVAGDSVFSARVDLAQGTRLPLQLDYFVDTVEVCTPTSHEYVWLEEGWHVDSLYYRGVDTLMLCNNTVSAPPAAPAAGRAWVTPNPSRGTQSITWSAAFAVSEIGVFDASGRRVAWLAPVGGATGLNWRGTDSGGRRLAAGVYWVRLQGAGRSLTTRLVRLN